MTPVPPKRAVGTLGGTAVVVGSILGIGLVFVPPIVAAHAGSTVVYLGIWLLGGAVALCGALVYGELGTRFPEAGGDYVYIREAFGPGPAFAAGWLLFGGVFAGSIATLAAALGEIQLPLLVQAFQGQGSPGAFAAAPVEPAPGWRGGAVLLVLGFTAVNLLGARISSAGQVVLVAVPLLLIAVAGLGGLGMAGSEVAARGRSPEGGAGPGFPSDPSLRGFTTIFLAVYFAFSGWNAVSYLGGEMKHPERTIPRSLLAGTGIMTGLYLVLSLALLAVLGPTELARSGDAASSALQALVSDRWVVLVPVAVSLALLASLNASILTGSRVGAALGEGRMGTGTALLLQGVVSSLLVLTGTFQQLLELTSIAMLALGSLAALSLVRIRRGDGADAPFSVPFYPLPLAVFLVVSLAVLLLVLWQSVSPAEGGRGPLATWGLALLALLWLAGAVRHRESRTSRSALRASDSRPTDSRSRPPGSRTRLSPPASLEPDELDLDGLDLDDAEIGDGHRAQGAVARDEGLHGAPPRPTPGSARGSAGTGTGAGTGVEHENR